MKTKPFNKERAIAGDPVVDTTGQRWEFVCDDEEIDSPLWFRIPNGCKMKCFQNNGKYWADGKSKIDLSMLDTTP